MDLVIYGEYLFLENFVAGIMILFFTGKILGEGPGLLKLFFCGCCCGAYAFVLFLPFGGLPSWLGKWAFSLLMVRVAFGAKERKKLLYGAAVFLGVTMLFGGITIAFLTSFSRTGVTAAAGVYLPPLTYLSVMAAATVAALFLWFLLSILKARRMEVRRMLETELFLGSSSWKLQGFIDSGNDLRDPLTGQPVCIVDQLLGRQIVAEAEGESSTETRYRVIPYRAVGTTQGIMEAYRMDRMAVSNGMIIRNPVIAFCEENHFRESNKDVQILLPSSLLEGGVYGDF